MLASMTGKKDAKRAALIHLLFNIIGTVIIYIALFVAGDQIVKRSADLPPAAHSSCSP